VDGAGELEKVYRQEATRIRAALAARLGDVGLAEELVQDAFIEALEHWRAEGVPPNPGGWLATTAWRKTIDRLRRERAGREKLALLAATQPRQAGLGDRPASQMSLGPAPARTRPTSSLAWSSHAAIRRCRESRRSRSPSAPLAV
jgi:predicted RNA polymerase sigma factor